MICQLSSLSFFYLSTISDTACGTDNKAVIENIFRL